MGASGVEIDSERPQGFEGRFSEREFLKRAAEILSWARAQADGKPSGFVEASADPVLRTRAGSSSQSGLRWHKGEPQAEPIEGRNSVPRQLSSGSSRSVSNALAGKQAASITYRKRRGARPGVMGRRG